MQIGILGNAGSWYVRDLQRAAEERGHQAVRLEFPSLVARCGSSEGGHTLECGDLSPLWVFRETIDGNPKRRQVPPLHKGPSARLDLARLDAVIVRTMPPGSLEQVVYRMDALARLEAAGVMVLNGPKSLECAVDKYLSTARLEADGLPVPPTVVCEHAEAALAAFAELGGDVVVKPIFGSEGRGIVRVSDADLALRAFRTLERLQAVLYLQQYVAHEGCDVRVMVLDGRVMGAMRRCSKDDFRTNVSRAARTEPHQPSDTEAEWALRAAQSVGARFAGVDILYDRTGQGYVIEVNAVPGWRAFARTTGSDVAALVIASLDQQR